MAGTTDASAWGRLPEAVRADVRRRALRGEGHPDPEVAGAAVAWARRTRRVRGVVVFAWLLILPFLVGVLVATAHFRGTTSNLVAWYTMALALFGLTAFALPRLNRLPPAVESANLATLVETTAAAPPAGPVAIRPRRRPVLLSLLAALGLVELGFSAWYLSTGHGGATPWLGIGVAVLMAAVLGMNLSLQLGRPMAVVGSDGLDLPRQHFTVPWSRITAVGPRQYVPRWRYLTTMLLRRTCVVWEISSIAAMGDSLRLNARQRRWLRQNARLFDPPGIGFPIALIRPDLSDIVAASRAFAARAARDTGGAVEA